MRQLRIGVGHARDEIVVGLDRQPEQRVPDDEAGVIVGGVGELRPASGVADGIDALVAGPEPAVDHDAVWAKRRCRPASRPRPSTFGLRPVATRRWLPAIRCSPASSARMTCTPEPPASTRAMLTPLRSEMPSRDNRSSTMRAHSGSSRASGFAGIQHGDGGAKAAERLRKLKPNRPGADRQ